MHLLPTTLKRNMKVTFIALLYALLNFSSIALSQSTTCMPGHYITNSGSCRKCPRGTFQPDANKDGCKPCPDDKVSMEEGSTECIKCGRNKTPSEFKNDCVCVVGATADRKGNCTLCRPGTYFIQGRRRAFCYECDPGTYQSERGQTSCLSCPEGTTSSQGARKCLSCPKGQFPLKKGECGTCPPGSTRSDYGNCQECDAGTFKATNGTDPCLPCPPNTTSDYGASKCDPEACPAGEAPIGKDGKCGRCPPGTYYSYDQKCVKCSRGYYMPSEGILEECFECPHTSFTKKKGARRCIFCPPGQVNLNNKQCGSCPPGTSYDPWNYICEKCGFNQYGSGYEEHWCNDCPERTYALPGSSTCFTCPDGQALIKGTRKCGTCPVGRFYDDYYANCEKCYGDSIQDSPGIKKSCKSCPEGTKANKGKTACVKL